MKRKRKASVDVAYVPSDGETDKESTSHSEEIGVEVDEEYEDLPKESPTKCPKKGGEYYFPRKYWNPLHLYRSIGDVTAAAIRKSGVEGVGRVEIARAYGVTGGTKAGNRRISKYIMQSLESFPDHFGHFQKMEGKARSLKYFYKAGLQTDKFNLEYTEWKNICGTDCPFKMGQVIKFSDSKLSTLRISDVSLRRLIHILRLIKEKRVIVTLHRLQKMLTDFEQAAGYAYQIDKKSVLKCVKALEKVHLVRYLITNVLIEDVEQPIQIVCEWAINSPANPQIETAIRLAIDDFNTSGRIFPYGQLKCGRKKYEEYVASKKSKSNNAPQIQINDPNRIVPFDGAVDNTMTFDKRIGFYRILSMKSYAVKKLDAQPETSKDLSVSKDDQEEMSITEEGGGAEPKSKKTKCENIDVSVNYGVQAKLIRCYLLHRMVWHFVYGLPANTRPTFFERFPPDILDSKETSELKEIPVYVDDESPFRFVPPMPQFENGIRGWFMLCDLINAFPLSLFALVVMIRRKCPGIEDYLKDPIKRHTLIGDLPFELRQNLLYARRATRQLEHLLFTLSGLGLARLGENPDIKSFQSMESEFFFIAPGGCLRDTSTSSRGYACVELPIEQYKKYDYTFNSLEDVIIYWQHMYAIVESTPLAFRSDTPVERNVCRKYAFGSFDKSEITMKIKGPLEEVKPVGNLDGCAGFDSLFFVHLKRHWELNFSPSEFVNWFMSDWRRSIEKTKDIVAKRVERLQKKWHSYMKALMPTDFKIWQKINVGNEGSIRFRRPIRIAKKRQNLERPKKNAANKTTRRTKDQVDLMSEKRRMYMRSRFTPKERYMLIIIRAVGYFLNPVYRFWLDATVLRDIMHERVPESRTKTVQNLMTAGVREMVRPEKMAYLKKIVRSLTTFPEMQALRSKLTRTSPSTPEEKRDFFTTAFNTALRLLFGESHNVPSAKTPNEDFEKFLRANDVEISAEFKQSSSFPARSQKPISIASIQHCTAFNVLMSTMLQGDEINDVVGGRIIEQIDASSLSQLLERLRIDGIITRCRSQNEDSFALRRRATFSFYFRHFFNHRYHPQIVELTKFISDDLNSNFTVENQISYGSVAFCLKSFYSDEISLDVNVDPDILNVFQNADSGEVTAIKQCKYLESTDLKLDKINVQPSTSANQVDNLPELIEIIDSLKRPIPLKLLNSIPFDDFLLSYSVEQRGILRKVHTVIEKNNIIGASLEDVLSVGESEIKVLWALHEMERFAQVVQVGIDYIRYVLACNSECWLIRVEKLAYVPTPWTSSFGDIYTPVLRWMAEGVFFSIYCQPGIELNQLKAKLCLALQPRMFMDLLLVLERCGCIRIEHYFAKYTNLSSPFDKFENTCKKVEYLIAMECGIERFSRIFGSVKKSETFLSPQTDF